MGDAHPGFWIYITQGPHRHTWRPLPPSPHTALPLKANSCDLWALCHTQYFHLLHNSELGTIAHPHLTDAETDAHRSRTRAWGRYTHTHWVCLSPSSIPSPSRIPSHPAWAPTSLDLLRSRTNLPSSSTSSTATRPLVRACWEKLLRLSADSSLRFLVMLPPPCVWDE